MLRSPTHLDWLALSGLVVAWGSSFAMTKFAVADLDASWVMALRLAVAAVFLCVALLIKGRRLPRRPALWGWFTWLGLLGHAAPFYLISWGVQYTTSGVAGLLMGAVPLFIIVAAHVFLADERLTPMKAVGFIAGFAGLLVILEPQKLLALATAPGELWGELAILSGCLCYTAHAMAARRIPFDGPLEQSTAVSIAAALMGIVFASTVAPAGLAGIGASALIAVVCLGIIPTALGTLLMYRLARSVGVSFIAYSNYLVPVFALVAGALIFGERLTWSIGIGLILIFSGIAASRKKQPSPKEVAL
jgi:drug/metabolite transporter (DMT)-like permease